jgi:hypothetical protein
VVACLMALGMGLDEGIDLIRYGSFLIVLFLLFNSPVCCSSIFLVLPLIIAAILVF